MGWSTLFDVLQRIFDPNPGQKTFQDMVWFLTAVIMTAAVGNAFFEFLRNVALTLVGRRDDVSWGADLIVAAIILVALLILFVGLLLSRRQQQTPHIRASDTPSKTRGLILLLSPFNERLSHYGSLETLMHELQESGFTDDMRRKFYATNWGPLVMATEYHLERLRSVWLVSSTGPRGSSHYTAQAKVLIEAVMKAAQKPVTVRDYEVTDASSVQSAAETLNTIYKELRSAPRWHPEEVTADFTGGTAAMSGGVQLTALLQGYPVQYLRQDRLDNPQTLGEVLQANALTNVTLTWEYELLDFINA